MADILANINEKVTIQEKQNDEGVGEKLRCMCSNEYDKRYCLELQFRQFMRERVTDTVK